MTYYKLNPYEGKYFFLKKKENCTNEINKHGKIFFLIVHNTTIMKTAATFLSQWRKNTDRYGCLLYVGNVSNNATWGEFDMINSFTIAPYHKMQEAASHDYSR